MKFQAALFMILLVSLAKAGEPQAPTKAIERFKGTAPLSAKVHLQRWDEKTLKKKIVQTQGSISLGVIQNPQGLQTNLEQKYVGQAAQESLRPEQDSDSEMPIRSLLKDLDYGRIHHLLDQEEVLQGLIANSKVQTEKVETWEGQAIRTIEYTFKPHLTPEESYRLNRSEGHLILRTTAGGLPLESEIKVTFEGRTSRMFGRYIGTKRTETRYKVVMDHLVVSARTVEEFLSKEDGSDITKTRRVFSVNAD